MKDIKDIQNIYFIGIGGIGMSALARYFNSLGRKVSGYDRTQTPLTESLQAEGIDIHFTEDTGIIPKDADVVVYTPAVPANHLELVYYRGNGYEVLKRSDMLGIITAGSFNICVAGTHGKTTISSMIAHLLRDSGYGCNAFLGGIATNYNTNFWSDPRNVCVVEADEYDRSFLKLHPDIAVISAMDPDHLDIYGTVNDVQDAFVEFSQRIKENGTVIHIKDLIRSGEFGREKKISYHQADKEADVHVSGMQVLRGGYLLNVKTPMGEIREIRLNMGGLHNVENMLAAIAVAGLLEIDPEKIRQSVETYRGVKRRFERITRIEREHELVYIDDYAHHPDELKALINGIRNLYPGYEIILVFQPHLFSRTRDFAEEFAQSLDMADEVIVLPIYPARELPVEGVDAAMLLERMCLQYRQLAQKENVVNLVMSKLDNGVKNQVLLTAGAGDIDTLVTPLKEMIELKFGIKKLKKVKRK